MRDISYLESSGKLHYLWVGTANNWGDNVIGRGGKGAQILTTPEGSVCKFSANTNFNT